jgi:hypothetical protein
MPTTTKTTRKVFVAGRNAAAAPTATAGEAVASVYVPPTRSPASATCCCPACSGLACLDRTRFFSGQLLTEADLNNEQSYWLAKNRLHNRYLNGWGVVCGLQVVCSECEGWVTVKTGYAIDPCGNDIIVCTEQPFNVLKAIQGCCAPTKQTSNCAPLRYTPPAECQNMPQHWCITIEYQEQQSRMVTPLVQAAKSCGCGSSKGGCGCGCGGSSHTSSNGGSNGACGCGCSSTQTTTAVSAGACEPTRIIEGFRLGICAQPATRDTKAGPAPGTAAYQYQNCIQGLKQLAVMAPDLSQISDVNQAYQAVCSYLVTVNQYFAKNEIVTRCSLLDALSTIVLLTPANGGTISAYQTALGQIKTIVGMARLDCFCMSLLPTCPPDPCDDRLILACVTVQNNRIVNICPFEGRQQLIGFTALNYWLGPIFSNVTQLLDKAFEQICCTTPEVQLRNGFNFLATNAYERFNVTTNGISSPAMFNQMFASFLAQTMGAGMVNLIAPQAKAVDLRSFVGGSSEVVLRALAEQGFKTNSQQNVTADPSWDAGAVAAGSQFAPSAVSSGQPLTVYTKGGIVVGIEVTDPTTILQQQVAALQKRVDQLTGESGDTPQSPSGGPSAPRKRRPS